MNAHNHKLENALQNHLPIVLELGCGPVRSIPEAFTLDRLPLPTVDFVCDLNQGLPFLPDNSVERIHSSHFLEHVENLEHLISECFRVLKPKGTFTGVVPHFSNPCYYSDYTHKHYFGLYTFSYFSKTDFFSWPGDKTYNSIDFEILRIEYRFKSPIRWIRWIKQIFEKWVNRKRNRQEFYEGNLSGILHAAELHFELRKPG